MDDLIIYRKRLIPDECILLKNDILVSRDDSKLVTRWKTIHPRPDMDHGSSVYYLEKGWKISRFCRADSSLLYWYCDIVDYSFSPDGRELTTTDLLADIIIYPDGQIRLVDLDELAVAFEKGLISGELMTKCLNTLDSLLKEIYAGNLPLLTEPLLQ
ncbi:MAG: DUF402 domain-containing protein [Lachnospiraceae bacterium]|nr:DUF402 domain-containing protein [Lachnospiraceae bacterium]